jgi:uncharacterized protein YfiM (DUF2279 family)
MRLVAAVVALVMVGAPGLCPRGALSAQAADPWIGRDKALHLGAGSTLAAGGYALGALKLEEREKRIAAGLGLSLGASAAKELYDRRTGGDPSWRDFTWGAAGAATGATIAWLIDRLRHR